MLVMGKIVTDITERLATIEALQAVMLERAKDNDRLHDLHGREIRKLEIELAKCQGGAIDSSAERKAP